MIDLKTLQKHPEIVKEALAARCSPLDVEEFMQLDAERRRLLGEVEAAQQQLNASSKAVASLKREGLCADAMMKAGDEYSTCINALRPQVEHAKAKVDAWLLNVPNIPHESVPRGGEEEDNAEVYRHGVLPVFDFAVKEHGELGTALGGLDFERAGNITGSRFTVYWDWAARLERALVSFFLDVHTTHNGYIEIAPPLMVNRKSMTHTGQLPKFEEDLFKLEGWEYFLIPTAEVPLTNLHAEEVLDEARLPRAYCAQTQCFRSEAGAAGKDTKGLIRQHQFTKVEMVRFAHPEDSYNQLELMRRHAEDLLERLLLPYRTIVLCTGDMGFSAAKTYDMEVWLPGQNMYREISSCSNCEDFQARRADIRFRPKGGKTAFAHTLNGSGLAVGRTLVAILENYQQKDGSVVMPTVLVPYMGGREVIEPAKMLML